ncbi:hypothetical protein [Streptomyces sp. CB01881]|uniref:hypothetical protein n=1 Tax=Streptomyces sp. CB01881 TaxID=2078691 RepID=UPI00129C1611|nr:hypothetical protein [Streptomyces sp. CB01881]
MACTAVAALLVGAAACGSAPGGTAGRAGTPGPAAAEAVALGPEFPEPAKRVVLEQAARDGRAPAGGRTAVANFGVNWPPSLVWQAESSGDICAAQAPQVGGVLTQCAKATDIKSRPTPGVGVILSYRLAKSDTWEGWNILLLASAETVERISCQQQDFPVRKALAVTVGGVLRTVYAVTVPADMAGTHQAAVRRGDALAVDQVRIDPEGRAVQC